MILIKSYADLAVSLKEQLNDRIHQQFGHVPIVSETEWAIPHWTVLKYSGDQLAFFYNIVEREVRFDDQSFKVAGVNNVITSEDFRGKGIASEVLRETESFIFDDLKCDLGLLVCADPLVPFYERLNWYTVGCPLYINQSSGRKKWESNTMLLSPESKLSPKEIDLMGLPW